MPHLTRSETTEVVAQLRGLRADIERSGRLRSETRRLARRIEAEAKGNPIAATMAATLRLIDHHGPDSPEAKRIALSALRVFGLNTTEGRQ
jgi:hypothetical protein